MKVNGNTVLITGGASGIGLALTQRFVQSGSNVIVCGRREQVLSEVKAQLPTIETRLCDVSQAEDRQALSDSEIRLDRLAGLSSDSCRFLYDDIRGRQDLLKFNIIVINDTRTINAAVKAHAGRIGIGG